MLAPRLARHWFEAGERGRAFLASLAAAGAAERQSAYAEAATHFDRALDLWSEAGAVTRDVDRASVLERAMWASFLAADFDDAIAHGFAALDALGLVPDRSRQIRILDTIERAEGRAAVDEPRGLSIAAEMSPRGLRPIDRMWLRSLHSLHLLERGDLPGAKSIAEPLLAEAESSGDVELQIHVNEVLAIEVAPSDPQRALDLLERARRAAADADDAIRLTEIEVTAGRIMLEHQFYERLRATMPAAIERAGRSGLGRWARPEMHYLLAHACMIDGELQRSWEQVELGRTDMPVGTVRAQLEIIGALVSTAMGEFAQAADCLEASRFPNSTPEAELARGWLATARAELALAERRFDDVASIVNATAPIVVQIGAYTSMTDTIWSLAEVGLAAAAEQAEQARAANDAEALKSMPATVERMTGWVADAHHQRDAA
ncbi:MAG TPA: hypothetical protein VFV72_11275, partial [Candidatus Limnocylindrales bacterium]|nr:hypothetical protein [Candidatus Limnocylindrales bacterium]